MFDSWVAASSFTTFKCAWKTATLLAFVMTKHCSDLTLLHIDNSIFFFSAMLLYLFLSLMVRWIDLVIFHQNSY